MILLSWDLQVFKPEEVELEKARQKIPEGEKAFPSLVNSPLFV